MRIKSCMIALAVVALMSLTTVCASAASSNTVTLYINASATTDQANHIFQTFSQAWNYVTGNNVALTDSVEIVLQSDVTIPYDAYNRNFFPVTRDITITSEESNLYTLSLSYRPSSVGVFNIDSGYELTLKNVDLQISSSTYTVNITDGTLYLEDGVAITGSLAPAVCVDGANASFIMNGGTISDCTFNTTANNAYVGGGGVFVTNNGSFSMNGGEISGNTVNATVSYAGGGGVFVTDNGSFNMNGGEISGNTVNATATYAGGGGVYVADNGIFNMNGGEISGNTVNVNASASHTGGGGVYVFGGTFNMASSKINSNTIIINVESSEVSGGGVYLKGNGTFTMTDGEVSNNTVVDQGQGPGASGGGPGVAIYPGSFTMEGGTISGNTSYSGGGGGVLFNGGTFTMNGGTISNNTAGVFGGGVALYGYRGNTAIFTMNGGTINDNTVRVTNNSSYGGGVYVNTYGNGSVSTFNMNGGTIRGNAALNGGGVYVFSGKTFTLSGVSVVKDNKDLNGSPSNVYSNQIITLTDSLQKGSEVWMCYPIAEGAIFASGTADSAAYSAQYFYPDTGSLYAGINGSNLLWGRGTVVAELLQNGVVTGRYTTLNAAIADYTNSTTQVIQLKSDIIASSTVDRDIYLDMGGYNIPANLTVNSGCTLYGLDSATDGYGDTTSYGRITGTIDGSGTVASMSDTSAAQTTKAKYYLTVTEGNEVSFHRYNVQVSDYYFRLGYNADNDADKGSAILSFRSAVQGDSYVADALTSLETSYTPAGGTEAINAQPVSAFPDLATTLSTGNPYYYPAEYISVTTPSTAQYTLKASLSFSFGGQVGTASSTRERTLREILGYFYSATTTTQAEKTIINEFLIRNGLTPIS